MMVNPSKRIALAIARAARLRAAGNSWPAIGRLLGRRPQTCLQWTKQYAGWWNHVYRQVQMEKWREMCTTCEQVLRKNLRSTDAKDRRWAANLILETAQRDPTVLSPEAVAEAELVHAAEAQLRVIRVTVNGTAG